MGKAMFAYASSGVWLSKVERIVKMFVVTH